MERTIHASLECFIRKDGKYLMLHRNNDKRIMPDVRMAPGGKREHCEGLFECARREILEETGLQIKNIQIRATGVTYLKDIDLELFFHFLTADYAGGELRKNPEDGELVWLTPDKIFKRDNLLAELKAILPYVFDENRSVVSFRSVYGQGNIMTEFEIEEN